MSTYGDPIVQPLPGALGGQEQPEGEETLAIDAIPLRHWGWWISAAIILFVLLALLWSLWHNPNVSVKYIGQNLFAPFVLRGVVVTLELTVIAMVVGVVGGTLIAVMRLSGEPCPSPWPGLHLVLSRHAGAGADTVLGLLRRPVPADLPGMPFTSSSPFGSVDTTGSTGIHCSRSWPRPERDGLRAQSWCGPASSRSTRGRYEAAQSLGMSGRLTMRRIILPQAMRVIIPPMGNETISMLKTTALVS